MFPPLKGDATVQDGEPTTIIRLILNGVHAVATDSKPTPLSMPAFDWKLSDEQIAALASYIRNSLGKLGICCLLIGRQITEAIGPKDIELNLGCVHSQQPTLFVRVPPER